MSTLANLLQVSARKHGRRTALQMKAGFRVERWTYADLARFAGLLASYLQSNGIAKGDRVLLWDPNSPRWVGTFFGCLSSGAVVVPLDMQSTPDFVAKVIDTTTPKLLLANRVTAPRLQETGHSPLLLEHLDVCLRDQEVLISTIVEPEDMAEVIFTSGTTGDPKGVVLAHRNIVSNVEAAAHLIPPRPSHRLLSLLPLSHMLEQNAGLLLPLQAGASVVYPASRQAGVIARVLREEGITGIVAVPQILLLLMNSEDTTVGQLERLVTEQRGAIQPPPLPRWSFTPLYASCGAVSSPWPSIRPSGR